MVSLIYLLICLVAGFAAGAGAIYLALRPQINRYARMAGQDAEALAESRRTLAAREQELGRRTEEVIALNRRAADAEASRRALEERLETQKKEVEALQERSRIEFRNLANDILDEKSRQFKETNKESLEMLLKPFRDNIEGFRKRVEEVYDKEAQQRYSLKEEVRQLNEMNLRMSQEANNLTNALKGNSKVQGDWGEMILETILDNSNLVRGVHYSTQESIRNEEGRELRPDVILTLPDNKQIVIDSKVSLTAYVAYSECDTPEARKAALEKHIQSMRSHVAELGSKRYQELVQSPDFVIMFVPTEPAFLLALQHDSAIWNDAYNKKVIISSPTNLFALLKIVDDLWKRDNQSKNAINIANEGANLYDKFVGFADTLADIGKNIEAASRNYDKAMGQLKTGRGNLIARTQKLRELGIKATKNLPAQLADFEEEEN